MPRRPVLKCDSNRILCPDPTCRHVQKFDDVEEGKFRGRCVGRCRKCGTRYFLHSADGGAELIGLWPDERIDVESPLPVIWRQLGVHVESAA